MQLQLRWAKNSCFSSYKPSKRSTANISEKSREKLLGSSPLDINYSTQFLWKWTLIIMSSGRKAKHFQLRKWRQVVCIVNAKLWFNKFYGIFIWKFDMVKHKLRVTSWKLKSTSWNSKAPVPRVTSSNPQVMSSNPRVKSSNPRIRVVRQFVSQHIRSVSGDNFLFYVSTTLKKET